PYTFKIPASPYFAAICENRKISINKIKNSYRRLRDLYPDSTTLIEGAGGLMVPIKINFLFIDLIRELSLPVILVASPYLGAINHTLLSLFLLKKYKVKLSMLVFSINKNELSKVEENTLETILKISKTKNYIIVPFQKSE
ncbi:MAG TPA: dethiobiotin synthase, partial [Victivallales bacterium]|nr:dethiobiotin synthase [Victivallales bacterium]